MALPLFNLGLPSHRLKKLPRRTNALTNLGAPGGTPFTAGDSVPIAYRLGARTVAFGTTGSIVFLGEYLLSYMALSALGALDGIGYSFRVDGKIIASATNVMPANIGDGWVLVDGAVGGGPIYSRHKIELTFTSTAGVTLDYAAQELESA